MVDWFGVGAGKKRRGFAKSFIESQLIKKKGKCYYCHKRFYDQVGRPHKHHKDGNRSNNKLSNLVLACVGCHDKETLKQQVRKQKAKGRKKKEKYLFDLPKYLIGKP